ncbi:hypothetical protein Vretimale_2527 [Volvox reticuliferus]|uniref:Uncharacterized protein n=1 Tax=Volvox reticuliferus TaxID=1737510 RepID=A0A8J4C3N5_9CHLO|nr:hypothetical protein Vretifemale_4734 [Volvox reticuliferus]GIL96719.1 hypothetical protein Vretimale_2527 [Volvox reticuliferus]
MRSISVTTAITVLFCSKFLFSTVLVCRASSQPKGTVFRPSCPPKLGTHAPVDVNLLWSKTVPAGMSEDAAGQLTPLFDYKFLLPQESLRAGLSYTGAARRLRKFVQDFLHGEKQMKIGVVGGSISVGMHASKVGVTDWFSTVVGWLSSSAKSAEKVKGRNGCRPATPSGYMVFCLENSVDPDVDLVFVEYSLNDGYEDKITENSIIEAKEQLIRRLLKLPGKPAVVLLQVGHVWGCYIHPFFYTPEDIEGALAAYYDVSSVSQRTSIYLLNVHKPTEGFLFDQVYDDHHPLDVGHKIMADLVVHLIQEVAIGLLISPVTPAEVSVRDVPLPPPMHKGNLEPMGTTCLVEEKFADIAIATEGWRWVNEGTDIKPKWGFVSTVPGSELIVRLGDTARDDVISGGSNGTFPVLLQYLLSYSSSMGKAVIDCLGGGCQCKQAMADGYIPDKVSVTSMIQLDVQWSAHDTPCDLRVTVLNETSTEGHKFKVAGVVLAVTNSLKSAFSMKNWEV